MVQYDGLVVDQMSKALLKQFIRSITNEMMLTKLRLQDKVGNTPLLRDLFHSICREELKCTERKLCHKKQVKAQTVVITKEVQDLQMVCL